MMQLLLLLTLFLGVVKSAELIFEVQQAPKEEHIVCPDLNSKCPNTATCCQLSVGQWGCCPFAKASCCPDQKHCCPGGFSCDANKGQCVKDINNETVPWAVKQPASLSSSSESAAPINSLVCPDNTVCSGTASCCRSHTGTFRCCSYPNDVCCSDGLTCCPRSTICDIVNRRCISTVKTEEWKPLAESTPAINPPEETPAAEQTEALFAGDSFNALSQGTIVDGGVHCNRTAYCPAYTTCCYNAHCRRWGCCPYRHNVCCWGGKYCCPCGKRCSCRYGYCI